MNDEILHSGETVIDITGDTVTPATLAKGTTAHDAQGNAITGELEPKTYKDKVVLRVSGQNPVNLQAQDGSPVRFGMDSYLRARLIEPDYEPLDNKPSINGYTLIGDKTGAELGLISDADLSDALAERGIVPNQISFGTTEEWSQQTSLVSEANSIYVYTDYKTVDGKPVAGFKVGDGLAYVVDLPFTDEIYARHIEDDTRHITQNEREFWNNKNRAYVDANDSENLILTSN